MQKYAGWILAGVALFAMMRQQGGGVAPSPNPAPIPAPAPSPAGSISEAAAAALAPLGNLEASAAYKRDYGSFFLAMADFVERGNCESAKDLRELNEKAGAAFASRFSGEKHPEVGKAVSDALATEIGLESGAMDGKRKAGAVNVLKAAALKLGVQ